MLYKGNNKVITRKDINRQISDAIRHSGLTQTEIAKRLGISPYTVSHYCCGNKMPALETFANLCRIININPAILLCLDISEKSTD